MVDLAAKLGMVWPMLRPVVPWPGGQAGDGVAHAAPCGVAHAAPWQQRRLMHVLAANETHDLSQADFRSCDTNSIQCGHVDATNAFGVPV